MQNKAKRKSSLENALTLLTLFSIDEPELSVTSVSQKLNVSKSTAHRLLTSLMREEFVYKDPKSNLYSLGSSILSLVNLVNSQIHISTEVIPLLNKIVENTKESAHLAILENLNVIFIQTIGGVYPCKDEIYLGSKRPAYSTAAGQILLAFQPESLKPSMLHLQSFTPYTITNLHELESRLLTIRSKGYAICKGEYCEHVTEIAVPVYRDNGDVIAAISIIANNERILSSRIQDPYIRLLQNAAKTLKRIIEIRKRSDNS